MQWALQYLGLIWNFIKRDIYSKYVGSFLGIFWSVLNPLILLVVYSLVFGLILNIRVPGSTNIWDFVLYFSAGFLPWMTLQESVTRTSRSIIDNKHYIKKVPFPTEIFPIFTVLAESVNLVIGLSIYFVLMIILKGSFSIFTLLLPFVIVLQVLFTLSLGLFLSSGAVFFRDIPHILGALMIVWFWATPIVYFIDMIPVGFQWVMHLNPAFYLIEIYHDILFYGNLPDPMNISIFLALSLVLFISGVVFFKKTKRGFGELL